MPGMSDSIIITDPIPPPVTAPPAPDLDTLFAAVKAAVATLHTAEDKATQSHAEAAASDALAQVDAQAVFDLRTALDASISALEAALDAAK